MMMTDEKGVQAAITKISGAVRAVRLRFYLTDPRRLTDEQKRTEELIDHPFSKLVNDSENGNPP